MSAVNIVEPECLPEAMPPTRDALERLAALCAPRRLCVTCYVRLGSQDRIRNRYQIAVHDAVRRATTAIDPGRWTVA